MKVKRISASDTIPLRHKILREGKTLEECHFNNDEDDQTFHLGAFVDDKLVSVASFFYNPNKAFDTQNQFQLRGMATLDNFRKQGLSKQLLNVAFPIIKQNFCDIVWCNARIEAREFYEKVGFTAFGDEFDIPGIGKHILMYKAV